jgi:hypothetical protein
VDEAVPAAALDALRDTGLFQQVKTLEFEVD